MFTETEMQALHEETFETAKKNLLRDGRLEPLVLLAFDSPDPSATLATAGLTIQFTKDAGVEADGRTRSTVAVVPTRMSAREMMDAVGMMYPDMGAKLQVLRQIAPPAHKGKSIDEKMLHTFCSVNGIHEKDILARYLQWLARKLEAYALVKVDEGWMKQMNEEESKNRLEHGGPAVEDMPGRMEVLMVTFESRTRQGMKTAEILRAKPGDERSKPVGFGDVVSTYDHADGRFFDLIQRAS